MQSDINPELRKILRALPTLTRDELELIRAASGVRISHNLAPVKGKATKAETTSRIILETIVDECRKKGIDRTSVALLSKRAKAFDEKVEEGVGQFLREAALSNKIRLRGLIRLGVHILIVDLLKMGVAVSARTVMNHTHRIPAVLNKAFPGYAASGILHLVVRKEGE